MELKAGETKSPYMNLLKGFEGYTQQRVLGPCVGDDDTGVSLGPCVGDDNRLTVSSSARVGYDAQA